MVPLVGNAKEGGNPLVWQWRDDCDRPTVIRIVVDTVKTRLLDTRMPLCKDSRQAVAVPNSPIDFPAHGIAARLDAAQDAALTGSVWVAGGEPDGVILGVSFQTDERVLLNTLRFVPSSGASQTDIIDGVRLSTTVEKSGKPWDP